MKKAFLVLACVTTVFGCAHQDKKMPAVMCIGAQDAKNSAVYLHGIDSQVPGALEIANRKNLEVIAQNLDLRIAVPRATYPCSEDSICWGWTLNADEENTAQKSIEEAAKACFPEAKKMGLIGFSNGGYLAAQYFRKNHFVQISPPVQWGVGVGSALLKGPLEAEPKRIEGKFALVIGKADHNYDPDQHYFVNLKKKSESVRLFEYQGGHALPAGEVTQAIQELISQ